MFVCLQKTEKRMRRGGRNVGNYLLIRVGVIRRRKQRRNEKSADVYPRMRGRHFSSPARGATRKSATTVVHLVFRDESMQPSCETSTVVLNLKPGHNYWRITPKWRGFWNFGRTSSALGTASLYLCLIWWESTGRKTIVKRYITQYLV